MRISIPRFLVRARRVARQGLGGAMYGAIVALSGLYGLFSAACIATFTTLVALVCCVFARE
ncbi:hypothetical protein [Gemmata obscuriglobus]|uniref:hypothetical protein n=1 Tax=Gemmata obscuriglobus TaxID=114 RepID=UPI0011CD38CA|nr:hypothetical protein [Gemmata obscuriglobus]